MEAQGAVDSAFGPCFCLWDGLEDEDIESLETEDILKWAARPRAVEAAAVAGAVVAERLVAGDRERQVGCQILDVEKIPSKGIRCGRGI